MGTKTEKDNKDNLLAVAVSYEGNDVPGVSTIGRGPVARELMSMARRYGVPVKDNPKLASKLAEVGAEEQIPPDLYEVVADLFLELSE